MCWNIIGRIRFANEATFIEWVEQNLTHLDEVTSCMFVTICWKIWNARNNALWNQKSTQPHDIVDKAMAFLHSWNEANTGPNKRMGSEEISNGRWTKPPQNWLKLNTDATLNYSTNRMGFSFILRDYGLRFYFERL